MSKPMTVGKYIESGPSGKYGWLTCAAMAGTSVSLLLMAFVEFLSSAYVKGMADMKIAAMAYEVRPRLLPVLALVLVAMLALFPVDRLFRKRRVFVETAKRGVAIQLVETGIYSIVREMDLATLGLSARMVGRGVVRCRSKMVPFRPEDFAGANPRMFGGFAIEVLGADLYVYEDEQAMDSYRSRHFYGNSRRKRK